ncbi:hypothetical protein [Ralstonia pseudosolanacearum]|uniref:hypothetical protein n=1 Tax=Ralstonia pseudosolanacearum TaxID=1310165 RepID=UPI001160C185|nr:hypothetical protein [Ralstonia pseudosolanacearum]QWF62306.1 hypothetical protein KM864_06975 [Ralstonia solanacearum]TXD97268.1 hypothetical protein FUT89_07340 [Ralstonia pseudosolanacearum]
MVLAAATTTLVAASHWLAWPFRDAITQGEREARNGDAFVMTEDIGSRSLEPHAVEHCTCGTPIRGSRSTSFTPRLAAFKPPLDASQPALDEGDSRSTANTSSTRVPLPAAEHLAHP